MLLLKGTRTHLRIILLTESEPILSENRETRGGPPAGGLTSGEWFAAKIGQFMTQNFILRWVLMTTMWIIMFDNTTSNSVYSIVMVEKVTEKELRP